MRTHVVTTCDKEFVLQSQGKGEGLSSAWTTISELTHEGSLKSASKATECKLTMKQPGMSSGKLCKAHKAKALRQAYRLV